MMFYSLARTLIRGLLLCLILTTSSVAQDEFIVRRAAFDIGSAAIKCTIADVNTETGRIVQVVKELSHKLDYAEDMARSYDGNLSKAIMTEGLAVLKKLKLIALEKGATEFSAVGGDSFRSAQNGRAYFATIKDEIGISSRVISKQQASLLNFHAVRLTQHVPVMDMLVWDIGGSNTQITARNQNGSLTFYINEMAAVSFKNTIISTIQGKDINTVSTPNPMSTTEVQHALEYVESYARMSVPAHLAIRIKRGTMNVFGIGGVHYYAIPELIGDRNTSYSRDEVKTALKKWTGKTDADFKSEYASTRLSSLILVLGYMSALDIDHVAPLKINQADGLLVTPEFW